MLVADYRKASLSEVDFAFPSDEAAKQRAGWLEEPQKAQYAASTLAVRDAAPASGSFPVVIYAPSYAESAHENLDLCEYLASQGYVVIASRSLGARMPTAETMERDDKLGASYLNTMKYSDVYVTTMPR